MKKILTIILISSMIFAEKPRSEVLMRRGKRMVRWGVVLLVAYGAGLPLMLGGIYTKKRAKILAERGQ